MSVSHVGVLIFAVGCGPSFVGHGSVRRLLPKTLVSPFLSPRLFVPKLSAGLAPSRAYPFLFVLTLHAHQAPMSAAIVIFLSFCLWRPGVPGTFTVAFIPCKGRSWTKTWLLSCYRPNRFLVFFFFHRGPSSLRYALAQQPLFSLYSLIFSPRRGEFAGARFLGRYITAVFLSVRCASSILLLGIVMCRLIAPCEDVLDLPSGTNPPLVFSMVGSPQNTQSLLFSALHQKKYFSHRFNAFPRRDINVVSL